jgi:intracellular septation protein A
MLDLMRAFRPLLGDFLSTIVFIIAVEVFKDVPLAIVLGIVAAICQVAFLASRRQPIALMQWMSLVLVLVLGGASLLLADPRFVMIKPSIAMFAIGCVMLRRGWMLRYLPARACEHVPPSVIIAFGYGWAALLFVTGAVNLLLALTAPIARWAFFNAVVPPTSQLALFLLQFVVMRQLVRSRLRSASAP